MQRLKIFEVSSKSESILADSQLTGSTAINLSTAWCRQTINVKPRMLCGFKASSSRIQFGRRLKGTCDLFETSPRENVDKLESFWSKLNFPLCAVSIEKKSWQTNGRTAEWSYKVEVFPKDLHFWYRHVKCFSCRKAVQWGASRSRGSVRSERAGSPRTATTWGCRARESPFSKNNYNCMSSLRQK